MHIDCASTPGRGAWGRCTIHALCALPGVLAPHQCKVGRKLLVPTAGYLQPQVGPEHVLESQLGAALLAACAAAGSPAAAPAACRGRPAQWLAGCRCSSHLLLVLLVLRLLLLCWLLLRFLLLLPCWRLPPRRRRLLLGSPQPGATGGPSPRRRLRDCCREVATWRCPRCLARGAPDAH